jgi:galactitol-specific phosphotransferase system IIC component
MIRVIFLGCLGLGPVVLIGLILTVAGLLRPVAENYGKAGAFLASLSLGVGLIGLGVITALGLIGASLGYVYQDKLPSSLL